MSSTAIVRAEAGGVQGKEASSWAINPVFAGAEAQAQFRAASGMAELAHDARNLMTALGLYCDLLEEPGVLTPTYRHYGQELRLVADASRRLMERMASEARPQPSGPISERVRKAFDRRPRREQIVDLHNELMASRNLLAAIAGPLVRIDVKAAEGAVGVNLDVEDLTRILVNLVKNAAEAMPLGGHIEIGLSGQPAQPGLVRSVLLTVEDNGPGLAHEICDRIFEAGVTSRRESCLESRPSTRRRGLGLSIVRSIVESGGGRIEATRSQLGGACFQIEFPVIS